MKKVLLLSSLLALGAVASYGLPACVNGGTLDTYIADGATGCFIGDKIFANFSYSGAGTDPVASSIQVGIDDKPNIYQFGIQLQSATTVWTSGFTLSYTIVVDQPSCVALYGVGSNCAIIAAQGAFQGALAPNSAALTDVLTPGGTISLNDLTTGANTLQIGFSPVTSTSVTMTATGESSSAPIDGFGLDVYQTSAIPEPVTMSLTGLGLLGLGIFGRRRLKS